MSYEYEKEKPKLFNDEGQREFMRFHDRMMELIDKAGAVMLQKLIGAGSAWFYLACADRMVELGKVVEVSDKDTPQQFRVFRSSVFRSSVHGA